MNPIISVIMSAYNVEDTIELAIASTLRQTFEDFELIVIDDGSTDNTPKIVKEYVKKDKRVILLQNKQNRGSAYTRNKGIKESRGKYVAIMDADDVMMVKRLEKQLKVIEKEPDSVVSSKAILMGAEHEIGGGKAIMVDMNRKTRNFLGYAMSSNQIKVSLLYGCPIVHPTVMAKKSFFSLNKYDESYNRAQDFELWNRVKDKAKFVVMDDYLIYYKDNGNKMGHHYVDKIIERTKSERNVLNVWKKYGTDGLVRYMKIESNRILGGVKE